MRTLPANLILEKNKLSTASTWLVLLTVTLLSGTVLRFVRNNEDVTYGGNLYIAYPFELDLTKESSKGEVPQFTLKISNITKGMQSYIEAENGCVGAKMTASVINYSYLSDDPAFEITFEILATQIDAFWITFTLGASSPLRRRFPLYIYIADNCRWRFNRVGDTTHVECNYTRVSASVWQSGHAYTVGERVYKTGTTTMTFRCSTAGTSGGTEPTWNENDGDNTTDNTVIWTQDVGCKRTFDNCENLGNSARFGGFKGLGSGGLRIV